MATMTAAENSSLESLPDLEKAIEVGYVSFSQLVAADWGRFGDGPAAVAYRRLYPDALMMFQASHGIIHDRFPAPRINCYAARTGPVQIPAQLKAEPSEKPPPLERRVRPPETARRPDFHFVYDLGSVPIGGELLTRIEMMASDATRILHGRLLGEFLSQLYSKTTDVLGIILHAVEAQSRAAEPAQRPPSPGVPAATTSEGGPNVTSGSTASAEPTSAARRTAVSVRAEEPTTEFRAAPTVANGTGPLAPLTDRLAIIAHDLDIIETKYLITDARLKYFAGAAMGMGAIGIAVAVGAVLAGRVEIIAELGRSFALALVFGAAGALISVVQRMSSNSLNVRYDLGAAYTRLLGGFRPVLGAFAGVLVWLLVQAKIIANPTGSDFFLAAIAFALGIAERSLGDVVTESGILARLTPGKPSTDTSKPGRPPTHTPAS